MPLLLLAKKDGSILKRIDLDKWDRLSIGRSPRCELTLTHPAISRRHALLFRHGGQWHAVDIGSRSGLFVGTERLDHTVLTPEQWVRLGPAYLWLALKRGEAAPRPGVGRMNVTERTPVTSDVVEEFPGFDTELAREAGLVSSRPATRRRAGGAGGPRLVVADAHSSGLQRFPLDGHDLLTIGGSVECDILLHDPTVEDLHCVIYTESRHWSVANVSQSGTRVEGGPVQRRRVKDELLIKLGASLVWAERLSEMVFRSQEEAEGGDDTRAPLAPEVGPFVYRPDGAVVDSAFFDGTEGNIVGSEPASTNQPVAPAQAPPTRPESHATGPGEGADAGGEGSNPGSGAGS